MNFLYEREKSIFKDISVIWNVKMFLIMVMIVLNKRSAPDLYISIKEVKFI